MRSHRIATALTTAALAALLLGGCAASAPNSSAPQQEAAQDAGGQNAGADPAAAGTALEDRSVVTTGSMRITVSDVTAATESAVTTADELGGRIDARSEETNRGGSSSLTIRVPADDYEALIERLRPLGTVTGVETEVVDVTLVEADLDARIESLRASVASLRTMLEQTTNVTDLLAVETQLSEREAELQSLESQKSALDDQVSMSTLWLSISNDELANPSEGDQAGFFGGLQAGWNTLLVVGQGLLTALGFALPGLVVLAILGIAIFLLVRALVRRSRRRALPLAQHAGAAAPAGGTAWNASATRPVGGSAGPDVDPARSAPSSDASARTSANPSPTEPTAPSTGVDDDRGAPGDEHSAEERRPGVE